MAITRRTLAKTVPMAALLAGAAAAAATDAGASDDFNRIAQDEWAWRQREFPDDEDLDRPLTPDLPDVGPQAQALRLARWREVKTALARIDRGALAPGVQDDFDVYRGQIDALEAAQAFGEWQAPFNSDSSFWGALAESARRPIRTEAQARAYLSRLSQCRRYFRQQIQAMRLGLARGFTPPRVSLTGRELSVAAVADAASPDDTVFCAALHNLPAAIPTTTAETLRQRARDVVAAEVIPAHRELLAFLRNEYLPGARATLAAEALPEGAAYYRSKIREFTTLELAPDAVHALGMSEMSDIRRRMSAVMKEVNFSGEFAGFLSLLRNDPRFYVQTPHALLDRAAWIAKSFDGKADLWFGRLPRKRFAIRPVPDAIAPFYTAGRGGPGVYLLNTYDLPSRPLYALTALTLHESAPGHAFQMPLAAEQTDQPEFRRKSYISAFGEGWALYCERLGVEMGMYDTAYDRFGMWSYQAWRAARLVVDTGVHSMGWSRQQALDYLAANTALSSHEVETEVDRYISWPGQALAYYLGQRAILQGRARAEAALGPSFDIRHFHDAVLKLGCVPLAVLDRRIDRFIAEGGPSPYAANA
ncbi:MAG TPA: DUF885 family protein [Caulobacteraceae bacterium]|jgi:uncharacterized protein (DUF885 family)|nr:DUF885 family protein [Caulobacteraceae bacterium]